MTTLRPGMRVELSAKARERGLKVSRVNKTGLGTVVQVSMIAPTVRILQDGRKTTDWWRADCWQAVIPHEHARCERTLARLTGTDRMCSIADDGSHGPATHAMKGLTGGSLPRCEKCFRDIYGPHDCEQLGCATNPCPDFGKILEAE